MERWINWGLLKEPYNWVIVALMLAIGVTALTYLQPALSQRSADPLATIPQ